MAARVQREDFDIGVETARFGQGAGAICMFVGQVRDLNEGRPVSAMTLEHYPGMTERELERDRGGGARPLAAERYVDRSSLLAGSTPRATASSWSRLPRRVATQAFDACRFIIDSLKTRAPFWKAGREATARRAGSKRARRMKPLPGSGCRQR